MGPSVASVGGGGVPAFAGMTREFSGFAGISETAEFVMV